MIAKITLGSGFRGVINYILDRDKAQQLFYSEGIRAKDTASVISSFITQSQIRPISKPVAHISLNFSSRDSARLTDEAMAGIAVEYMQKMGYVNTQFIIARHHDREHPHCHLVINRIDNDGSRISDKNGKRRSVKVCMALTRKYGLYIAKSKENVKRHRLTEPDKTKYEIYDTLKATIPECRNWKQLTEALKKQDITTDFRRNGKTDNIQGICFQKNGYTFNGSQIDRSCSYSKISIQLKQNHYRHCEEQRDEAIHIKNQSSASGESISAVLSGLFNIQPSGTSNDLDEEEFQRLRKRKKRGYKL